MKRLALAVAIAALAPSLVWAHGGGLDQYGCHTDAKKGDYHCHQGTLKGRNFKSQETMLAAHPELRADADKAAKPQKNTAGERAKKAKAEDKVKNGDTTTTDQYAKDAKSKASSTR